MKLVLVTLGLDDVEIHILTLNKVSVLRINHLKCRIVDKNILSIMLSVINDSNKTITGLDIEPFNLTSERCVVVQSSRIVL
jgi:hypothetical protein